MYLFDTGCAAHPPFTIQWHGRQAARQASGLSFSEGGWVNESAEMYSLIRLFMTNEHKIITYVRYDMKDR